MIYTCVNFLPDRKELCKFSIISIVMVFCLIQQFSQSGLSYHLPPDKQKSVFIYTIQARNNHTNPSEPFVNLVS